MSKLKNAFAALVVAAAASIGAGKVQAQQTSNLQTTSMAFNDNGKSEAMRVLEAEERAMNASIPGDKMGFVIVRGRDEPYSAEELKDYFEELFDGGRTNVHIEVVQRNSIPITFYKAYIRGDIAKGSAPHPSMTQQELDENIKEIASAQRGSQNQYYLEHSGRTPSY